MTPAYVLSSTAPGPGCQPADCAEAAGATSAMSAMTNAMGAKKRICQGLSIEIPVVSIRPSCARTLPVQRRSICIERARADTMARVTWHTAQLAHEHDPLA